MGLGIYPKATIPTRGFLRRRPGRDAILREIRDAVVAAVTDPLLARFVQTNVNGHTLGVVLHPAAEPLAFTWHPQGTINVSAKTSTVGPGFHAYCVDIVEDVGERCRFRWQWADADEAEYALARDFAALQQAMRNFLRAMARSLMGDMGSDERYTNLAVNWSIDLPFPQEQAFTITPNGPRDRSWWRSIAQTTSDADLDARAREFFPWWSREADGEFWFRTGLVMLWSEIAWHPPADDAERAAMQLTLECFARARQTQPTIELPTAEIAELAQLVKREPAKELRPPRADGIGFRRRACVFRVSGRWTVEVPGYFYLVEEDEGGTILLWYGTRNIRISTYVTTSKDDPPSDARELLAEVCHTSSGIPCEEVVEFDEDGRAGSGAISEMPPDEQAGTRAHVMLQGRVAVRGTFATATITYIDPTDRDWAIRTFRSLKAAPIDPGETER